MARHVTAWQARFRQGEARVRHGAVRLGWAWSGWVWRGKGSLGKALGMQLIIKLKGERPLLMHNGRLANPMDKYTREISAISGKRSKTDDDRLQMLNIEARGGCWETTEGLLGIPNAAVWRCLYNAATAYKRGEDIKRGLSAADETTPLYLDGEVVSCDEYLKDFDHIDYRAVKIQKSRTMRARPRIAAGWESEHHFTMLDDVMDLKNLQPIIERAGRLVGLGDWRPTYGTFTASMTQAEG